MVKLKMLPHLPLLLSVDKKSLMKLSQHLEDKLHHILTEPQLPIMVESSPMFQELTATHPQFHTLFFQLQALHGSQHPHPTLLLVDGSHTTTSQLQVDGKLQLMTMKPTVRDSQLLTSQSQLQMDIHHINPHLTLELTHQERL
jgi:hypothetical protein